MESRPWLKNYPARWDLDYSRLSLYHYLKQAADQYPEQTALIYNHEHVTYREMILNIDRTWFHSWILTWSSKIRSWKLEIGSWPEGRRVFTGSLFFFSLD